MPKYSRWEDAMVAQAHAYAFVASPLGQVLLYKFEESINDQHPPDARLDRGTIPKLVKGSVGLAEPVYVSGDVTEVIDAARHSFQPEAVIPSDVLMPNGFLLFPRAVKIPDAVASIFVQRRADVIPTPEYDNPRQPDGMIPVRAFSWLEMPPGPGIPDGGLWITFWMHADDDATDDGRTIVAANPHGTLSVVHTFVMSYGRKPWEEDLPWAERERGEAQWLLPQVTWRLMQQFVAVKERLPRQLRRDAKRKRLHEDVTVITLRRGRANQTVEEGEGGHLTCRFPVSGHWRNQWYPSLGPASDPEAHRQIWIDLYVKGPDDAPLKLTKRVFEFTR